MDIICSRTLSTSTKLIPQRSRDVIKSDPSYLPKEYTSRKFQHFWVLLVFLELFFLSQLPPIPASPVHPNAHRSAPLPLFKLKLYKFIHNISTYTIYLRVGIYRTFSATIATNGSYRTRIIDNGSLCDHLYSWSFYGLQFNSLDTLHYTWL